MLSPSFLSLSWCQGFHLGQWERCQPHASTQCHKHIVVEGKQFTHTNCHFKAHSLTFMYNPILSCINLDNTFMIYRCQSLRGEFMPPAQTLCCMSLPALSPPFPVSTSTFFFFKENIRYLQYIFRLVFDPLYCTAKQYQPHNTRENSSRSVVK